MLNGVTFTSQGKKLLGGFYVGGGQGARPTAILLHGVPGVEKNLDIAYALRDAGWNCVYFHYRGCWGSEGTYSLEGLVDDVRAATDWVLKQPLVDPTRLALVGSSIGGYAALAAGSADSRLNVLVPICPLLDPATAPLTFSLAEEFATMLHGISASELQRQWQALEAIHTKATHLQDKKILLITGDRDELFPPEHNAHLVRALPRLSWERLPAGDHTFNACRTLLVHTVLDWLRHV